MAKKNVSSMQVVTAHRAAKFHGHTSVDSVTTLKTQPNPKPLGDQAEMLDLNVSGVGRRASATTQANHILMCKKAVQP